MATTLSHMVLYKQILDYIFKLCLQCMEGHNHNKNHMSLLTNSSYWWQVVHHIHSMRWRYELLKYLLSLFPPFTDFNLLLRIVMMSSQAKLCVMVFVTLPISTILCAAATCKTYLEDCYTTTRSKSFSVERLIILSHCFFYLLSMDHIPWGNASPQLSESWVGHAFQHPLFGFDSHLHAFPLLQD